MKELHCKLQGGDRPAEGEAAGGGGEGGGDGGEGGGLAREAGEGHHRPQGLAGAKQKANQQNKQEKAPL